MINVKLDGTARAVPLSKTETVPYPAVSANRTVGATRMVQTVATTRQMMADGDLVVTRLVMVRAYHVSSPDASQSVPDSPEPQSQSTPVSEQARPYAAVPVQGGWLVFQL
jgi:hypothetical protein